MICKNRRHTFFDLFSCYPNEDILGMMLGAQVKSPAGNAGGYNSVQISALFVSVIQLAEINEIRKIKNTFIKAPPKTDTMPCRVA